MRGIRRERPLCRQCGQARVNDLRSAFCSTRCAGLAKQTPRPLCAFCEERPVKKLGGRYCGKSCAVLDRGDVQVAILREGLKKSQDTQRTKYFARVNAFLKVDLEPVLALVAEPLRADVHRELMKFGGRVYRRAYGIGYRCARNRVARGHAA